MQANRSIVYSLLGQLETAGMAESFVRIVGADEQNMPNIPVDAMAWLTTTDALSKLLARCVSVLLPSSDPMCDLLLMHWLLIST